jgi:hypothetical protein
VRSDFGVDEPYDVRTAVLRARGIAVWDVLHVCRRGSAAAIVPQEGECQEGECQADGAGCAVWFSGGPLVKLPSERGIVGDDVHGMVSHRSRR